MLVGFVAGKAPKAVAFLLASCCWFGVILSSSEQFAAGAASAQDNAAAAGAWQMLSAKEDNFSIMLPVRPEVTGHNRYYLLGANGEPISEERIASAYHNGVVYLVRMYTTPGPARLFSRYPSVMRFSEAEQSNLQLGSIEGKQYVKKGEGYVHLIRLFPTRKRLYVLEAATRTAGNADIERFFSSLTLGEDSPVRMAANPPATNKTEPPLPVADSSAALTEKEVTHPAVVIYKPQPPYPDRVKSLRISGTVKYSVVFMPSGEVTNIKTTKDVGGGLGDAVAQVVKSIKFLPAVKDGRLVPQQAEVSYNFVLR